MCAVRSAENISTRLLAGYHGIGETSFRGYPTLMEQWGHEVVDNVISADKQILKQKMHFSRIMREQRIREPLLA